MSNESENKLARRADDKRADRAVDWTDAPRFTAHGIAETWGVTVEAEGQRVVTITDQNVKSLDGGRLGQFFPTIRSCAQHLLGFIGAAPTSSTGRAANAVITGLDGLQRYAPSRKNLGAMVREDDGRYFDSKDVEGVLATTAGEQAEPAQADPKLVRHGHIPSIEITLRQAKALVECFGGNDAEISIIERPAAWAEMPKGLYAYFSEYPEEGSMYLGPTEVLDEDDQAALASPEQVQAEPVAWMDPTAGCVMDAFLWQKDPANPQYSQPVYAAPSAAQVQAEQRHLPEEAINQIIDISCDAKAGWIKSQSDDGAAGTEGAAAYQSGKQKIRELIAAAPIAAAPAAEEVQTAAARIAELEAQLAECAALSQKWAAAAGDADGRAEQARKQAQWISVDERLPPACQTVIVHSTKPRTPPVDASYISTHPAEVVADDQITHWMPLPAAPAMKRAAITEGEARHE